MKRRAFLTTIAAAAAAPALPAADTVEQFTGGSYSNLDAKPLTLSSLQEALEAWERMRQHPERTLVIVPRDLVVWVDADPPELERMEADELLPGQWFTIGPRATLHSCEVLIDEEV